MEVNLRCPDCRRGIFLDPENRREANCRGCGRAVSLAPAAGGGEAPLDRCLACGCPNLYLQKDFNRRLGLLIVVTACALYPFTSIAVLFAAAALDALLYALVGSVVVCYACEAIHRGFPRCDRHRPFEIGIKERYRRLAQEKEAGRA